ncbi:MAG TPA: ADP-glyceromanno-heptose 6-epimerase [Candidatus Nanoarchaeia archaeon]|nr:ADP-glyceromanno-heptose 6-epimerase [Candidatus Nanoarchaeia archaeon]
MGKMLVTGGAGFIGSNLVLKLEEIGHEAVVLDNFLIGNMKNLHGFKGKVIKGNESELSKIKNDFDAVFHQAAITDTTITDKDEMFGNNVEGFKKIITFCGKNNSKLVYASSAAVYGACKTPMKEDQELSPLNVYGQSKMEMDKIAKASYKKGTLVGLRYFNVFGPREKFKGKMASMIYQLALQMKSGKRPRIFKHGEQERDHVYVKDIVKANLKAMEYNGFEIFNAATGTKTSFNHIVDCLNKTLHTNLKPEYFDNPYTGKYQDTTVADMGKSEKALGFKHDYSIEEGIKDYVNYMNENGW